MRALRTGFDDPGWTDPILLVSFRADVDTYFGAALAYGYWMDDPIAFPNEQRAGLP